MKYLTWIKQNISDLHGKTIVITGANSGIGFYASRYLAYQGAHVIMACRSRERGQKAVDEIIQEVPNAKIDLMIYDQASFQAIDRFVDDLKAKEPKIDVLVLNAGIYHPSSKEKTAEGLPLTVGTNFVGMYHLLKRILPYLDQGPSMTRVVFVGSVVAYHTRINDSHFLTTESGSPFRQYSQSKTAIEKFFSVLANGVNLYDLAERKHISFTLMHPGVTNTNIIHSYPKGIRRVAHAVLSAFTHCPEKASLGIVLLAGAPYVFNGSFYGPRGPFEISGFPSKTVLPKHIAKGSGQFIYDAGHLVEILEKGGTINA